MIRIDKLFLNFNGKDILRAVDLHLQPGDIYGLLGPNGAGKTTTIFAMLGLKSRCGGQIAVLDRDPENHALDIRKVVGVMPENGGFYEWMTGISYLKWYSRLYGQECHNNHLCELLERVGLGSVARLCIKTYSRGMKQRLAVARALVTNPRLLILDEPTNGLDPKGRREIHDLLLEFVAEGNTGILLSTHILDDVERLCNRIGIIDQGRTRIEGRIEDTLAKQNTGQHFRLRLEFPPSRLDLPSGLSLLSKEDGWWRVCIRNGISGGLSAIWETLLKRGWRILEIRSDMPRLEELYMTMTTSQSPLSQEGM
ncbi:MAG: ABC transporter ATP-binding protein [Desulfobacteraceae bacterium]|nr:ABC transporter ATP-binding protein [Desulfobacteraceae bacterium]